MNARGEEERAVDLHAPLILLPGFYCPTEPAEHPAAAALTAQSSRWMLERGLAADPGHAERLTAADFGKLVAATVPHGRTERLRVLADLNVWFHALDGVYGDENLAGGTLPDLARLTAQFVHALYAPEASRPAEHRFTTALRDVARRVAQFTTADQYADWIGGLQSYFLCEQAEHAARLSAAIPDLDSYTLHCAHGRAARPSLTIVPAAAGYQVPAEEMASPVLRALTSMAAVIVCWDNDRYSIGREIRQPGHVHNLLTVLAARRGCHPLDVLDQAVSLRDRVMTGMLALRERASATLSAPARRYAEDLLTWIRGQVAWGTASPRFIAPEYGVHLRQRWADAPADADPEPPAELACVHWWWTADLAPRPAHPPLDGTSAGTPF